MSDSLLNAYKPMYFDISENKEEKKFREAVILTCVTNGEFHFSY